MLQVMTLKESPNNKFIIAPTGKSDDYKMMSDFHHCLKGPDHTDAFFFLKTHFVIAFLPIVHTKTTKNAAENGGFAKG